MTGKEDSGIRTALVTGAASGIGAACVGRFLQEGWQVIGWDIRPGDDQRVLWKTVDVSDWNAVAAAAENLPPLGVAINCAGIGARESLLEMSEETWDSVITTNLNSAFYVSHLIFPALQAGRGTVVNIASITATSTFRNRAAYSAAKAGLLSLTRSMAVEWAEYGIRAIALSPGFTRTPMVHQGIDEGRTREEDIYAGNPQHRLIEPWEIAAAIFRLTSDEFPGLTGSNVLIDAGFDAWGGRV